ncbi:MAG: ATP-binding cassette domain-containing protein [Bdellovibrionota bacterium]
MIRLTNLGKKFDDRWIFRKVNLHLPTGSSLALVGPSGAGKSVMMKIVAGLLPADEGRVELGTQNFGMLFQKNALFDSLTCAENLTFPLYERKGVCGRPARLRASEMLKHVGLEGTENLYPDEISGGMQKRLGIARALIVEPEMILYDEPTAGLDPVTSRMIADLILSLRKQLGSTLFTITTDMQRAYQLGDRISLLAQGALVEAGTPGETQGTENPMIRQFIYGLKTGPLTSGLA